MAKEMFYASINNVDKRLIDTKFSNVIFITSSNSKIELLYKNFSCKVIEKNYRYVLDIEDEIKQDNDFFSIFEKSLFAQKTLRESSESKIVFVIDSGCIFNGRAREFTNWLELIDKSFGSQNLYNSSCVVIESVSKDSDPILELQSLMKDSFNRISDINLKLLDNWLVNEKITLIEKFSKKDLGKYDGISFQKELNHILQKCSPISYLDSKPFLPNETVDFQRAFYKEISNEILKKIEEFIPILYKELTNLLTKDASTCDFNQFKKNYHNILTKLDIQEHLIYKSMLNFCNILNIELLQNITDSVKQLEDIENKITSLMYGVLDLHDLDTHGLDFRNNINNLKMQLKEDWDESITRAEEVIRTYSDLYSLFELNEKCKLDSKKIGLEFYWKKRDTITKQEVNKLFESNKEFCSNFNKIQCFYHSNNQLKQAIIGNLETYSKLSPLYEIIYQSIIKLSMSQSSNTVENFINLYAQHVQNVYTQLYDEHNNVITNLEKEYDKCVDHREKLVIETGGIGGAALGIVGATALTVMSGGTFTPFILLGGLLGAGTGGGAYLYKKQLAENCDYEYGFDAVGQYYKQLPKDLRESWADINTFPKLAEYLKKSYPENKIYSRDEERSTQNYVNIPMKAIEEDKELKKLLKQPEEGLINKEDETIQTMSDNGNGENSYYGFSLIGNVDYYL
jgi:hypothetical protein